MNQSSVASSLDVFLSFIIEKGVDLGGNILKSVLIFIIGRFLISLVNKFVSKLLEKRNLDPSVKSFTRSLVNVALVILLIIGVIGALGVPTTSFAALLASAGVAVGMALSGNLSNFAGGLIILLFKPFRIGDFVEVTGDTTGVIKDIQIFHTVMTTLDNKIIFVPNGILSNNVIINYSAQKYRRLEWIVSVEYGQDFDLVKSTVNSIIEEESRILHAPEIPEDPFVALHALADSSVNVIIRGWVRTEDYWDVHFSMNQKIYEIFNTKGIGFPFPQLTIHQSNKA